MTTHLTKPEQEALLTLALMAAFADGGKSDVERAEVKRIAENLAATDLNPTALYQRVLLRQTTPADAAAPLASLEARQPAYEIAVCVCEADLILKHADEHTLRRRLRKQGMSSLLEDDLLKVSEGITALAGMQTVGGFGF